MSRFFTPLAAILAVVVLATSGARAAVGIEAHTSPAGHDYWLVQEHSIPIVAIEIGFANGGWADPEGKEGLTRFTMSLMHDGAGEYDAVAFEQRQDEISARFGFGGGRDGVSASARFLKETLDESIALFALAMTDPRFDADAIERTRAQTLSGIAQSKTQPSSIAGRAWYAQAYAGHPYGRTSRGTEESISSITVEDLRAAHRRLLIQDGTVVSIVGAVTPEEAGQIVDGLISKLPTGETPVLEVRTEAPPADLTVIEEDVPQSIAIFGQAGLPRTDPDYVAAVVMNHILGGGGFSSWLTEEVREKRGLAYSVGTSMRANEGGALILGSVQTENARISESLDVIREQWRRMAEGGVTEEELVAAKTYLTGSFPLGFDSNAKIANYLVFAQEKNLGIDYINQRNGLIEAVTLEDVHRVAARLLKPEELSIVVVGQPKGL